jgi:alpha-galactosidase
VAVVLYNKGEVAKKIKTTASLIGLRNASSLRLQDLVSKAVSESGNEIEATVPPHGSIIYRVSRR